MNNSNFTEKNSKPVEFPRRRSSLFEQFTDSENITVELKATILGGNNVDEFVLPQRFTDDLGQEYYHKLTRRGSKVFTTFPAVSINNGQIMKEYGTKKEVITQRFYTKRDSSSSNDDTIAIKRTGEKPTTAPSETVSYSRELSTVSQIVETKPPPMSRVLAMYHRKPNTAPELSSSAKSKRILPTLAGKTADSHNRDLSRHRLGKLPSIDKAIDAELPDFSRLPMIQRGPDSLRKGQNDTDGAYSVNEHGEIVFKAFPKNYKEIVDSLPDIGMNFRPEGKLFADLGLAVDRVQNSTAAAGDLDKSFPVRKEPSKYEIRKQYGKNLERNWFLQKLKRGERNVAEDKFDLKLDLFYSPTPSETEDYEEQSEIESERLDVSPDMSQHDDKKSRKHLGNATHSEIFSSTDVLTGEHEEMDTNRSTPSEYETVLVGNKLVVRKTKHKMRKKRMRRKELYQKFMPTDENTEIQSITHLSDTQLRAMRLKLSKKKPPKIKGRRKFIQAANVVFAVIKFNKLLEKVRKRRKKNRKIMKKSKKVSWKSENVCTVYDREPTPVKLKRKFLEEIGFQLIKDVANLNLKTDEESDDDIEEHPLSQADLSEFDEDEMKELLSRVSEDNTVHRLASRRKSEPGPSRPIIFPIEITEKQKSRKRDRSKSRSKSRGRSPNQGSGNRDRNGSGVRRERSASSVRSNVNTKSASKVKVIMFDRREVLNKRRLSLDESSLKDKKAIELEDLLEGIDLPAKDIRIQIAKRKMRKNKRRQELKRITRKIAIEKPPTPTSVEVENDVATEDMKSDSDSSVYCESPRRSPVFSGGGVSWNLPSKPLRRTYTEADIERELRRVTRLFMEMKECSYIRWTPLNKAIISRLEGIK